MIGAMVTESERLFAEDGRRPAGVRGVIGRSRPFADIVASRFVRGVIEPILGPDAFPVRSLLFDKSPDANWDVPWHQDTTIAVERKADVQGFGPWSVKVGVPHVRPPASVLDAMLTVRLHLDDCGEANGSLLVVPGSHRHGIVSGPLDTDRFERERVSCVVHAGGAVLMKPLLIHASRKAAVATHRRVFHVEFAACPLPEPLEWARL
jgi:ectoine hydroxylase-related dioxygenase (phytanoyl-CoA dioxygenase family)